MNIATGRMQQDSIEAVTDIWKQYQKGLEYQSRIGLRENLPKYVDFYEGRQWPASTENTKNLPRPVINIVKMICRNKKSALLSVIPRLVFRADNKSADAKLFTEFADYIQREMRQRQHDKQAVADGVIKGSYFYHYYWDAEGVGLDGQIDGAVRCENIDPLDIFFENPRELDEQKQKWIIIASRVSIDSVRAKADEDVNLDEIASDDADKDPYRTQEQDKEALCTVLTKYFRRDGQVYCVQATKNVVFKKPWHIIPEAPRLENAETGNVEAPNNSLPDNDIMVSQEKRVLELYPVVAGYYEKREKCIYGLSEVEGLIPNQKAINFHMAMSLLNAQEMAWGKWIALPNALKGQKISNAPGQVLIDYSGTGDGIKKAGERSLHSLPLDIVNMLADLTRSVSGATEVMSGELPKAGMSGAAIAQLQAQAQQPIEELRESFWLVKEKQGLVLAQFFKHFYRFNKRFSYKRVIDGKKEKQDIDAIFNSSSFDGVNFSVTVEATQGTRSSVVSDVAMLDSLLSAGKIDVKAYVSAYPDSAIGNKSELLELLEQTEQSEAEQLKAQVADFGAKVEQYLKIIEQQRVIVDNIVPTIQENNRLKADFAALQKEYADKISLQNHRISSLDSAYRRAEQDAGDFAEGILRMQNDGQGYPVPTKV